MLNHAGEILFALELVLSSLLFYWLVSTLSGVAREPRTAEIHGTGEKHRTGRRY
jgi:hypothetical protein